MTPFFQWLLTTLWITLALSIISFLVCKVAVYMLNIMIGDDNEDEKGKEVADSLRELFGLFKSCALYTAPFAALYVYGLSAFSFWVLAIVCFELLKWMVTLKEVNKKISENVLS